MNKEQKQDLLSSETMYSQGEEKTASATTLSSTSTAAAAAATPKLSLFGKVKAVGSVLKLKVKLPAEFKRATAAEMAKIRKAAELEHMLFLITLFQLNLTLSADLVFSFVNRLNRFAQTPAEIEHLTAKIERYTAEFARFADEFGRLMADLEAGHAALKGPLADEAKDAWATLGRAAKDSAAPEHWLRFIYWGKLPRIEEVLVKAECKLNDRDQAAAHDPTEPGTDPYRTWSCR